MFKNISKYITTSLIITFVWSTVSYVIRNRFISFDEAIVVWVIRILIYALLAWGLFSIGRLKQMNHLRQLAVILPLIAVLNPNSQSFFTFFGDDLVRKILLFTGFLIVASWVLYIIFSSGKTLFGFLIMINAMITVFIYMPYGIPMFKIWYSNGFYFNWSASEYYNLNTYRPFTEFDQGIVPFLLDIRAFTSICFLGYMLLLSFFEAHKLKYDDKLANKVLDNNNAFIQFLEAGVFFIWKIIQRLLFFSKNFFSDFIKNIVAQIIRSKRSYIFTFLLLIAFTVPLLIKQLAKNIHDRFLYDPHTFPDTIQIGNIVLILVLCLIPLLLVTVLKYDLPPSKKSTVERPYLYLPIYITLFSLGLTSIIALILEHRVSYYLIIFLFIVIAAIIWGITNIRKQKKMYP